MLPKVRTSGPGLPCSGDRYEEALGCCRVVAGEHSGAGPVHLRIWRAHHPRRSRPRDGSDSRRLRQHQEGEALEERGQRPPGQSEIAAGQGPIRRRSRHLPPRRRPPSRHPRPASSRPPLPFATGTCAFDRAFDSNGCRDANGYFNRTAAEPSACSADSPAPPHLLRRRPLPRLRPRLLSLRNQPRRRLSDGATHRSACG